VDERKPLAAGAHSIACVEYKNVINQPAPFAIQASENGFVSLVGGKGLHSSTFQLNLSRFGHASLCPHV